jgi:hypothetical protein
VEKYSRAGQAMDDNIISVRRMRLACWITKATHTHTHTHKHTHIHTHNVKNILFYHSNNGYAEVLRCYVICTSPLLFSVLLSFTITIYCHVDSPSFLISYVIIACRLHRSYLDDKKYIWIK